MSLRELTFFCILLPIVIFYYAKLTLQDYVRAFCNKKWIEAVESTCPQDGNEGSYLGFPRSQEQDSQERECAA